MPCLEGAFRNSPSTFGSIAGANAGLNIERDILKPVKKAVPEASTADIWTLAGAEAVAVCGGPKISHAMGRVDAKSGAACPAQGRLPDAAQGAAHLRDVFYRMGFDDKEIVALSAGRAGVFFSTGVAAPPLRRERPHGHGVTATSPRRHRDLAATAPRP